MCAKTKTELRLVGGFGGILRLHAGPLTHRTAGRIDALISSFSLNHRTKKTTPMVAAMRKADIIRAHHIARVRSFSESSRLTVSLHQMCQALISILGFNSNDCSRRDRSARQVSVEKPRLVENARRKKSCSNNNKRTKATHTHTQVYGLKISTKISNNIVLSSLQLAP